MAPARADRAVGPTLAVLGAQSTIGAAVRAALEALRIPGHRVALFGTSPGEALLGEYAGEARLIQEPAADEIRGHSAVFVCETESASERLLGGAAQDGLVLDLTDSEWGRDRGRLAGSRRGEEPAATRGVLRIPHVLSSTVADMLRPIDRGPGLREASVVVFRPASDFGEPGVEELRAQTVNLLNFFEVPKAVFGRQLAFNLLPQSLVPSGRTSPEDRIVRETADLLGHDRPRVTARLVVVPVFLGHGILARVAPREPLEGAAAVRDLLQADEDAPVAVDVASGARSILDTEQIAGTLVSEIKSDGLGGFWIWATVEDAGSTWARSAVRWAARSLSVS